jgi:hypothetical protein
MTDKKNIENFVDSTNYMLTVATNVYSDETVFRSLINLIPLIGSSLDILLSGSGQKFVIKRIEKFISELREQLSELQETQINKGYLETEKIFDLIIKTFNASAKTRQQEKLKLYARIIKAALKEGKKYEEDEPELFLKIVEELSVKELRVAKCLYEMKETPKKKIGYDIGFPDGMTDDASRLSKQYVEFGNEELVYILVRLEKTGLIKELVGTYMGYRGGQYLINPLFKQFINFIEGFE